MKRGAPLNPFSACFHQPGVLPYRFREGGSAGTLWRRFAANGRRGEIVGPHGTGKTTLLRALERFVQTMGEPVVVVTLHNGSRWPGELLPWPRRAGPRASSPANVRQPFQADQAVAHRAAVRHSGQAGKPDLRTAGFQPASKCRLSGSDQDDRGPRTLFLDGAEQLAPVVWHALRIWARVTGSGLLVTTHRPLGLPTLHTTSVDAESALWVTRAVLAQNPGAPRLVEPEFVPGLLASCHGNLRDVLFRLYDTYEERWAARM